jgi:hypothetical protein
MPARVSRSFCFFSVSSTAAKLTRRDNERPTIRSEFDHEGTTFHAAATRNYASGPVDSILLFKFPFYPTHNEQRKGRCHANGKETFHAVGAFLPENINETMHRDRLAVRDFPSVSIFMP